MARAHTHGFAGDCPENSAQVPVDFAVHQTRRGRAGAREDFQELIAQLVAVTYAEARSIASNPGDWGIDALVGTLHDTVVVWQAKYFFPAVTPAHQQQIRASFASAHTSAARHGYRLVRWVLCVPSSMDGPTAQWWDGWRARTEQLHGIRIELWDDTNLRRMIIAPEAEDVRRHYFGDTIHGPMPQAATREHLDDYLGRFTDFLRTDLHPLVPLSVTADEGRVRFQTDELAARIAAAGSHIQVIASSGIGKSYALTHAALSLVEEGWLPILVHGAVYRGDFADLLDQTIAAFSPATAAQLLRAAAGLNMPVVVILDGANECPAALAWLLAEQVSAWTLRNSATLVLGSQHAITLPSGAEPILLRLAPPDARERTAILTAYGAAHIEERCEAFTTPFELAIAARLAEDLPRSAGRAELLDAYIRRRLAASAHPTLLRDLLRRLAVALDDQLASSLDLGEAERICARAVSSQNEALGIVDELLVSPLVRVEQQRLAFAHELLARTLAAEGLMLAARTVPELALELCRPRHRDLAPLAVPLEADPQRLDELLTALADETVFDQALSGALGERACIVATMRARRLLQDATGAISNSRIVFEPDLQHATYPQRTWAGHEVALLRAIGNQLYFGAFLAEAVALLRETEAACRHSDAPRGSSSVNDRLADLLGGFRSGGLCDEPAAKIVMETCHQPQIRHFLNRERAGRSPNAVEVARLAFDATGDDVAVLYLLAVLLERTHDPVLAGCLPRVLEACWASRVGQLRAQALMAAEFNCAVVDETTRHELISILERLDADDFIISSALAEALKEYGLITSPHAEPEITAEIHRLLERPSDPEGWDLAYTLVGNTFENVVGEPFVAAIEQLADSERNALYALAAQHREGALWNNWIMRALIDAADPVAVPAFTYWASHLDETEPFRQSALCAHSLGIQGCAVLGVAPPSLQGHSGPDAEAWRTYAKIIHCVYTPGLPAQRLRIVCAQAWEQLQANPTAAVDPLYQLDVAARVGADLPDNALCAITRAFPDEVRRIAHYGLKHSNTLTSIYGARALAEHRPGVLIRLLAEIGDAESTLLLSTWLDHPQLGSDAVAATRAIRERR